MERLADYARTVAIAGFRDVKIEDVEVFLQQIKEKTEAVHTQFFNASLIASQSHLFFAALNALNAFNGKVNISDSLAVEVLLYASAQRQIRKALDMLGIDSNSRDVAVLIVGETEKPVRNALDTVYKLIAAQRDDTVLEIDDEKFENLKELFDVSDLEIEANLTTEGSAKETLINLIIERVALLATQK